MEKSLLFLITSIVFVNAQTIDYPLYQGTFDGTVYDEENGTFVFPYSAQSWAGFANVNENIYPLYFPTGGKVQFTANTSTNVEVYFRFEANPYPNVDPAQNTNTVTILAKTVEQILMFTKLISLRSDQTPTTQRFFI